MDRDRQWAERQGAQSVISCMYQPIYVSHRCCFIVYPCVCSNKPKKDALLLRVSQVAIWEILIDF